MSDIKKEEIKTVEVKEVKEVLEAVEKTDEIKAIAKEVIEEANKKIEKKETKFSPFVSENDRFKIETKYYVENEITMVYGVDDKFDDKKECDTITVFIKRPSQADSSIISSNMKNRGEMDVFDLMQAEVTRLLVLIRDWSLKETLSNEAILNLNPKIVKSILTQIREKIGVEGII